MESLKAALDAFVTRVTKSAGLYTAVIGIFFYHVVFEKDFECTCNDQTIVCRFYMILPAFIILFMLLWLDGSFHALLKSWLNGAGRFRGFLLASIFKAFFISLLWPISVMVDGDWYICCYGGMKLDCGKAISFDDQKKIKELKNTSRIIGFGVLLGIIFLAGCLRFPWKECCTRLGFIECCCCCFKNCCTRESGSSTNNNKEDLYKKIVCEEGKTLVRKKLIEVAKSKIDEKIDEYAAAGEWEKCFGVVDEIIGPPPNQNNPNHPPGGSSSESPPNNEAGEAIIDHPQNQNNPNHPTGGSSSAEERLNGSGGETEPLIPVPRSQWGCTVM